jgi:Cupin domain
MHLHTGEEIIRILSGELVVRVADQRRTCRQGDLAIIPPNTLHGFRVVTDTVMEVIAEQHIGTFFPVQQADGTRRLVEVYTPSPWNNPSPGLASTPLRKRSASSCGRSTSRSSGPG